MEVLVTGATGIVGAGLVRALLARSYRVRALVRSASDVRGLEGLTVKREIGDVLDRASLITAMRGCTLVFHAAASFSYSALSAAEQMTLAVEGTRNVVAAAAQSRVERVVVTSSSVVLGSTRTPGVLDEASVADEPEPSAYAQSKIAQERTAFEAGAKLGIDVVAVCPTLVIGAFDYRLSTSNANLLNYLNDPFRSTFTGGCNVARASDVGAGHVLIAERGRSQLRYVLGAENLTWRQLHELTSALAGTFGPLLELNQTAAFLATSAMEYTARIAGVRPLATRDEARMSGRFYWYSSQRSSALGYQPAPARLAVAEAIAWLLHREWVNEVTAARLAPAPEVLAARASLLREVSTSEARA